MAAGVQLGFLKFVLGFDSVSFKKGMSESERDLVKLQKSFQSVGKSMTDIGAKLSLGITAPLAAFAAKGIAEARETAEAMAQVNAALTSMGPVAGKTATQLEAAANAFEGKSLFEADAILRKVTANLLTFGNISGTAFDRAQQSAIDLAARLGTDLQSATILVGKALNDPVKGMAALSKAGIQFTAEQKETIKALVEGGQAAKAQSIILGELEKQFGGAAAAAQNADPFNKLTDAFNSIAESLGTILLPVLTQAADFLAALATKFQALSPETQKWVAILAGVAAVAGPVLVVLGSIVTAIGALAPVVTALSVAWAALKVAFIAAKVAAVATLPALLPFLVPLGAIAAAVGAAYLAWKNWDKIAPIVQKMVAQVSAFLKQLLAPIKWVIGKVGEVNQAFFKLYDNVVGNSYIPDMVTGIGQWMAKLDDVMVAPTKAATKASGDAFDALKGRVAGIYSTLFPEVTKENQFVRDLADIERYAKLTKQPVEQLTEAIRRLQVAYDPELFGMAKPEIDVDAEREGVIARNNDAIERDLKPFDEKMEKFLSKPAKQRTAEVIEAFGQMAVGVVQSLRDMVDSFKSGDILGGIESILSAVLDVLGALGRAGVISLPGATPYGGARAAGGPVVPGKSYLVGENGPEFITPRRSGFVHPNGSGGGRVRVDIGLNTPLFNVAVDGRARNVAAPMALQGAMMGASGAATASERRQRKNLSFAR